MSGMVVMQVFGYKEVAADFQLVGASAQAKANAIARQTAQELVLAIQAHASGRPGPNVITGEYLASWYVDQGGGIGAGANGAGEQSFTVTTDALQANRLEYGFSGVDSMGRSYHQPPFPHVGPAIDEVEPTMADALAAVILV